MLAWAPEQIFDTCHRCHQRRRCLIVYVDDPVDAERILGYPPAAGFDPCLKPDVDAGTGVATYTGGARRHYGPVELTCPTCLRTDARDHVDGGLAYELAHGLR